MTKPDISTEEMVERRERRRAGRMKDVDHYPPQIRNLIHEYGLMLIRQFLDAGVSRPRHIRALIECTLNELSPVRGSFSRQGIGTTILKPGIEISDVMLEAGRNAYMNTIENTGDHDAAMSAAIRAAIKNR